MKLALVVALLCVGAYTAVATECPADQYDGGDNAGCRPCPVGMHSAHNTSSIEGCGCAASQFMALHYTNSSQPKKDNHDYTSPERSPNAVEANEEHSHKHYGPLHRFCRDCPNGYVASVGNRELASCTCAAGGFISACPSWRGRHQHTGKGTFYSADLLWSDEHRCWWRYNDTKCDKPHEDESKHRQHNEHQEHQEHQNHLCQEDHYLWRVCSLCSEGYYTADANTFDHCLSCPQGERYCPVSNFLVACVAACIKCSTV